MLSVFPHTWWLREAEPSEVTTPVHFTMLGCCRHPKEWSKHMESKAYSYITYETDIQSPHQCGGRGCVSHALYPPHSRGLCREEASLNMYWLDGCTGDRLYG